MTQTPLELAQHYVAQGWPVFPCRSHAEENVDQATGEIITLSEKTPLTPNGFKGATRFARIIERWWSDWPDAAVGLPTGEKTGFFALDIDNKPGGANGFDWLSEMEAEHGPLPDTARVTSPNGGLHIYFKYVVGTRNRGALGAGVDIRSEGGYVLAAGSTMANGRSYKWETDTREIADAPAWLLDLLLPKSAPAHTQYSLSAATNNAYVDAAVDRELADLAGAPMGTRNNALNDAAFSIGTIVGAGALSEAEARALLQDVARGWGRDWSRCCKTIENGLTAGIQNPRHIPEPDFPVHDNTRLVDITRMIQRGLEKGRLREQAAAVAADVVVEDVPQNGTDIPAQEVVSPVGDIEPANDNEPPSSPITATAFKWIDPKTLPRREFAYGSHFIRKYVSVTVSPGGLPGCDRGMSPIGVVRNTVGNALAGEKVAGKMFKNGLLSSLLVSSDQILKADQRKQIAETLTQFAGSEKAGGVTVLEAGFKPYPMSINPKDAQFLEARQYSVEQICRIFGVPPVMIGHAANGTTTWGSGIEQLILQFTKTCMRPMLKRIEAAIYRDLLDAKTRKTTKVKFNMEELLRGDSTARAEFLSKMVTNGIYLVDEARSYEDKAPVDGGNKSIVNGTMTRLDTLGKTETPAPTPAARAA